VLSAAADIVTLSLESSLFKIIKIIIIIITLSNANETSELTV